MCSFFYIIIIISSSQLLLLLLLLPSGKPCIVASMDKTGRDNDGAVVFRSQTVWRDQHPSGLNIITSAELVNFEQHLWPKQLQLVVVTIHCPIVVQYDDHLYTQNATLMLRWIQFLQYCLMVQLWSQYAQEMWKCFIIRSAFYSIVLF